MKYDCVWTVLLTTVAIVQLSSAVALPNTIPVAAHAAVELALMLAGAIMIGFSIFTSIFMKIVPDLEYLNYVYRAIINIFGLFILLFGIAVHLKVNIAVHPMDVYLYVIQKKIGVLKGTYFCYFSGFSVAIIFGLLNNELLGIGLGTAFTLLLSGLIMKFYNSIVLSHWNFK